MSEILNYKDTINLPHTEFPMRGEGPKREPEIQEFWFNNNIYSKVLDDREKNNIGKFLLHDGPPYLSSPNIHIGTALNKILKDIVVKYKTASGFYSPYVPGFDCHGLPIESAISKEKKKDEKSVLNPIDLRNECTDFVIKNKKSQESKFKRLGVLGDWENAYMTIYPKFEANQLELFGKMVDKGYIYRGLKPVYWCPACQTALAEAEVEYVDDYKSLSVFVAFKFSKFSASAKELETFQNLKVVIWTTTPWTLPGNLAVCLNEKFDYVVVNSLKFGYLLLAKDLLNSFLSKIGEDLEILHTIPGKDIENSVCQHPFLNRESLVILGDHVTLDAGTGCVHTAPGHGLEDFAIAQKYNLSPISPVDSKGLLTLDAGENLKGLYVHKAANQKVIEILSDNGSLIFKEDYFHSYPHCWRSKTPVIFRATDQWFCSVRDFRSIALEEIKKVKWVPSSGENRIYSMVESRTDWCISRQRIWGVPIPAFYCVNCNKLHLSLEIINFVVSLVRDFGSNVWWEREAISLLPSDYKCTCGNSKFRKESDTMDVWFDSGSTHYSVVKQNPMLSSIDDVLYLEGSDQHRGWFQSSLLTSVAMSGHAPYKTVLTHGFVLDENGRKMSKSLGNVVDPEKVIGEYGADILRLWVASTDYTSDMRIGQNMLKQLSEIYRNIRNTLRFILGNLYDYDYANNYDTENLWAIDKFALYSLENIKREIYDAYNNYEFYKFYQVIQNYCTKSLSSFYFDIVKDRLYTGGLKSRKAVQYVLSEILNSLLPILYPILPHLAEDVWRFLPPKYNRQSLSVLFLRCVPLNQQIKNYEALGNDFNRLLLVREISNKALEDARANKSIGKSLDAKIVIYSSDAEIDSILNKYKNELSAFFNVSQCEILSPNLRNIIPNVLSSFSASNITVDVVFPLGAKCPRCWKTSDDIGKHSKHSTICYSCACAVDGN